MVYAPQGHFFLSVRAHSHRGRWERGNGHAWDEHVLERDEFPEISTPEELEELINHVVQNPTQSGALKDGRFYAYDKDTNTLVISDPNNIDGGTVMRPTNPSQYLKRLK